MVPGNVVLRLLVVADAPGDGGKGRVGTAGDGDGSSVGNGVVGPDETCTDGGAPLVVVFGAVSELTVGVEVTRLVVSDVGGLKVGELVGREA